MTRQNELNRRMFLQAGAAGMVAVTSPASAFDAENAEKKPGYIDAHSHIWTRDVKSYPLRKGQTVADLKPPSFTTEELIKVSEPEGVDRVVLIAHHTYYGWDNSYMTDAARKHPGRFRVVGMIDDLKPHPDVAMRKLLKQRVTGFRITSWDRGKQKWLDSAGMALMWKTAAKTRQAMCCLINPEDLPDVDKMCAKNPETPVVIDHFARVGIDGTIRESDLKNLCRLARHKNVSVKVSAYYALGKKAPPYTDLIPMIRRVYDAFGPQRLMWASDCPYQLEGKHTYRASISLIRERIDFLSKADREWLLKKTAEKVYFFDA